MKPIIAIICCCRASKINCEYDQSAIISSKVYALVHTHVILTSRSLANPLSGHNHSSTLKFFTLNKRLCFVQGLNVRRPSSPALSDKD